MCATLSEEEMLLLSMEKKLKWKEKTTGEQGDILWLSCRHHKQPGQPGQIPQSPNLTTEPGTLTTPRYTGGKRSRIYLELDNVFLDVK